MRFSRPLTWCALVAAQVAIAVPMDNPYKVIFERNSFKLTSPPAPQVAPVAPPQPPPNVKFSGISDMAGEKKAWFVILPTPPAVQTEYLGLRVGERSGILEVKQIIDDRDEVKVMVSGSEKTLNIERSIPKGSTGPVGGPPPAVGVVPPPQLQANAAVYGAQGPVAANRSGVVAGTGPAPLPTQMVQQLGGQTSRVVANGAVRNVAGANIAVSPQNSGVVAGIQSVPNPNANVAVPQLNNITVQTGDGGLKTIPTRTLRLSPTPQTQPVAVGASTGRVPSVEESTLNMAVQKEVTRDAVARRDSPPLPPLPEGLE